jgi:hypothetical protein
MKKILIEDATTDTVADAEVVTENDVVAGVQDAKKSNLPKRLATTKLDAQWFRKTVALAIKHKTNLQFLGDKVWGMTNDSTNNYYVIFPSNAEWCAELTRLFPAGATFAGGDAKRMKAYAAVPLDEKSTAAIDPTTFVVTVKGAGVKIKNGGFVEGVYTSVGASNGVPVAPVHPTSPLVPFDFAEVVPVGVQTLLQASTSTDTTRAALSIIWVTDIAGSRSLVSSDGRCMACFAPECEIPDDFLVAPQVLNPKTIKAYLSAPNEHEVDVCYYELDDGVLFCMVRPAYKPPNFAQVADPVIAGRTSESIGVLSGAFLKSAFKNISKLGLKGVTHNALYLENGAIIFETEEGEVARFDATEGELVLPEGKRLALSPDLRGTVAFANLEMQLNLTYLSPNVCHEDGITFIVMPLRA